MKGLVWIIGLALLMPGIAKGQHLDSKRNCVHVGYVRSLTYLAGLGSVGYERSLNDKISLQFTFAMNPFRSGFDDPSTNRLLFNFAAEGRYYFALRRNRLMSGFFAGVGLSHENIRYYSKATGNLSLQSYWSAIGATLGYQHAFGKGIHLALGTMPGYPDHVTDKSYDPNGQVNYQQDWPADFTITFFIRLGITL